MSGLLIICISSGLVISIALGFVYWAVKKHKDLLLEWADLDDFSAQLQDEDHIVDEKYKDLQKGIKIARSGNQREIQSIIDHLIILRDNAAALHNSTALMGNEIPENMAKINLMDIINKTQSRIFVLEEFHFYEYGRHHTLPFHLSRFKNYLNNGSEN